MRKDILENWVSKDYNPDEERDDHGRWTDGGGEEGTKTLYHGTHSGESDKIKQNGYKHVKGEHEVLTDNASLAHEHAEQAALRHNANSINAGKPEAKPVVMAVHAKRDEVKDKGEIHSNCVGGLHGRAYELADKSKTIPRDRVSQVRMASHDQHGALTAPVTIHEPARPDED